MSTKTIFLSLGLVILTVGSFYYIKNNGGNEYLLKKKDTTIAYMKDVANIFQHQAAYVQSNGASSSTEQKSSGKAFFQPLVKKIESEIVTPGPLKIKSGHKVVKNNGTITISGIIDRTNYERTQDSLLGLSESSELDASAQVKANDILKRQYFEHASPDGKGVGDLVEEAGYEYVRVGENLALGDFNTNIDIVTAWMNSPGHRANILDKKYQDIGIGIAFGNYEGRPVVVAVQHFGRPRSSCPNVDEGLKTKVENLQSEYNKISGALDLLKNHIETMRANGEYVDNTIIDTYNNSINQYNSLIAKAKTLRDEYNNQIIAFNVCLASL